LVSVSDHRRHYAIAEWRAGTALVIDGGQTIDA
jgi:hypothetical protein